LLERGRKKADDRDRPKGLKTRPNGKIDLLPWHREHFLPLNCSCQERAEPEQNRG